MSTTYYVATAGSNSNNGTTTGTPFLTIAKAQSVAIAGDTVNLNGGDTFSENVTFTVGVTLQSYGTGQATWAGGTSSAIIIQNCDAWLLNNIKFTMSSTSNATAVYQGVVHLSNTGSTRFTNPVAITNCDISGGSNGLTAICPNSNNAGWNNLTISGNTIHDCSEFGIYLHESGNTGNQTHYSFLTISNNVIFNITGDSNANGASGIGIVAGNVGGRAVTDGVTNSTATITSATAAFTSADIGGIVHGSGIPDATTIASVTNSTTAVMSAAATASASSVTLTMCNILISGNTVHDCGASATQTAGPGGIFPIYADGVIIRSNVVRLIHTNGGTDGVGIDLDLSTSNSLVEKNWVDSCDGAGYLFFSSLGGNVFRDNIAVGNCGTIATGGIFLSGTGGCTLYNNTVVNWSSRPALYCNLTTNAAGKKIYNNILVGNATGGAANFAQALHATTDMQGNDYQSGGGAMLIGVNGTFYTTLAAFRTATSLENLSGTPRGFAVSAQFCQPRSVPTVTTANMASITNYAILPTSGVLGQGLDLFTLLGIVPSTTDYAGNVRPSNGYSIGAINPASTATVSTWTKKVIADSPYSWIRLGDASGSVAADYAFAGDGTYTSCTLGSTALLASVVDTGSSVLFNGTTSNSNSALSSGTTGYTGLTAMAWIKPASVTGSHAIICDWGNATANQTFLLSTEGTEVQLAMESAGGVFLIAKTSGANIAIGSTYLVGASWVTSNTMAIYVNGVAQTIVYSPQSSITAQAIKIITIGRQSPTSGAAPFSGNIQEALVFLKSMTSAQHKAYYYAGLSSGYTSTPAKTSLSPSDTDVFTFAPNGASIAVVTPSVAGGGSFSPSTVTFDGTATAKTSTYTAPGSAASPTVSYGNDSGLNDPANTLLHVAPAPSGGASINPPIGIGFGIHI